jgi:uncharacterized protein with NRDE domain
MCTVTFIPTPEGAFLVSNRDEKHYRSNAHAPKVYEFRTGRIAFPKDGDAGGTWIAFHENGNAIVLLNGGFEGHDPEPPYRMSRGRLLLDVLDNESPVTMIRNSNLDRIEPFTAVIWEYGQLFECVWDGKEMHLQRIAADKPHIWSSATLYDAGVRARRKQWFDEWRTKVTAPSIEDVLRFHEFTGDGDPHNDLLMNRSGQVYTVSITGLCLGANFGSMIYRDLKTGTVHELQMHFTRQPA